MTRGATKRRPELRALNGAVNCTTDAEKERAMVTEGVTGTHVGATCLGVLQ